MQSNIPEFSVSELAFSLKHTVEEHYSRVRVRGEISRVAIPKSGHMYTSLKDDKAIIDDVCGKGQLSRLAIRPEEGLEVICTGKMTTYPGNSRYQLIIESMELAGEGALLKMLEERKKKLAAEGLFAPGQKKALPFLPEKVGVVTSPTDAVIRDILHRLADRFPRNVILWPVKVQGEGAAKEIAEAISGLNALKSDLKPDIIIVARGGGSLEDLMPFNEEIVVRATSESVIPIISAVGHETDTTLIDYAADYRAPTPTGAAEIAVPVRINLRAQILDDEKRLTSAISSYFQQYRHRIDALSAKLGDPARLLELKMQHLDRKSDRLDHAIKIIMNQSQFNLSQTGVRLTTPAQIIEKKRLAVDVLTKRMSSTYSYYLARKGHVIERTSSILRPPLERIRTEKRNLARITNQLQRTGHEPLKTGRKRLTHLSEKLEILSFENILARGYVVVRDQTGTVVTQANALVANQAINLQFKEQGYVDARVTGKHKQASEQSEKNKKPKAQVSKNDCALKKPEQRSLF